jgi:hypothetical protein
MSGSQSRAKGSSIALVGPVEFGPHPGAAPSCRWKTTRKHGCCGTTARISASSTRWRSPSGRGQSSGNSSARRRWPARRWSA